MRYAILADIHGNIEALDKVRGFYKKERIDRYLCAGDIVGYGANPKKCIDTIKNLNAEIICGNHDLAAAGMLDYRRFNPLAQTAVDWTSKELNDRELDFLRCLPLKITKKSFYVVHGSLSNPEYFPYILNPLSALECFRVMRKRICFVGHTHVPGVLVLKSNKVKQLSGEKIRIERDAKYIVNAGSVGQPRDRDPRASFCVLDTKNMTIEIKRCGYNIEKAAKNIVDAGLPDFLAKRLFEGR